MLNRWQRTIVDLRGNVVPYAQLQILREQTQSAPTIYRDKAGTEVIPNAIVTANQNGYAYFYAPADLYRIRSTQPTIDWRDVDLGSAAAQQLAQQALDSAVPTYETLVDMQADTGQPVPTLGRVVNDSTLEDNGYYVWTGSAWERAAYQYLSEMDVSIEPAPSKIPRATGDGVIREAWVEDLPFNYDQIYAQIWSARYPGIPAPSFYQEFGGGASLLDPRITFSRSGEATYIKNGRLLTAGVDEPVFEDGGLRVWSSVTNLATRSNPSIVPAIGVSPERFQIVSMFGLNCVKVLGDFEGITDLLLGGSYIYDYEGGPVTYTALLHAEDTSKLEQELGKGVMLLTHNNTRQEYDKLTYLGGGLALVTWVVDDSTGSGAPRNGLRFYESFDGSVGLTVVGYSIVEGGRSIYIPLIPTNGQPETMPADKFQIAGHGFARAFNPQGGALVFKIGEGSALTYMGNTPPYYTAALWTDTGRVTEAHGAGVYFHSFGTAIGFWRGVEVKAPNKTRHSNAINHNIYPGDTVGLSWAGNTINLYVNGQKRGEFTHEDVGEALQAVERFHIPDPQAMYLDTLSLFGTAPTDEQMEALTNA